MSIQKLTLPGMEAYEEEEEVTFASPISQRHANTTSAIKPNISLLTQTPSTNFWALGKQPLDDERVFTFDEEEKLPAKRETRGKKTKSRIHSRWDSSSENEHSIEEEDEESNKENQNKANMKELIEIEEKLAKIKLEKEAEASKKLVVVVDTNCLVDRKQREAILAMKHYTQLQFIIPFIVLQELDKLKTRDDAKGQESRQAVQFLNSEVSSHPRIFAYRILVSCSPSPSNDSPLTAKISRNNNNMWIRGQCQNELPINTCKLLKTNDDQILKCCLYYQELAREEEPGNSPHDVLLITLDRMLQVKAKSHNISSIDGITMRTKLDDSWQETTRIATGIFFKDGKLCTRAASPALQRCARTSGAQSPSAELRVRASVMHAWSSNAAAANAPCRDQVIALASTRNSSRNDENFANNKRVFMR